ncbi:hypothetical protein NPIL_595161 [Nephila pilipes]|uniref:Uncharacterized protein n=1 Tax=Nephila pilipes TaxID=299642 RepID=A0A8X6MYT8_NEPPI|nr:hypothetical protein NPIL_595161 [Nephila pilipes]
MLVVGAVIVSSSAVAGIGSAVTRSKYDEIMSELKDQNKEMSDLIKANVEEKAKLEKEKMELMKSSEERKKELVDLMKKMAQTEEEAEEKYQVLISRMEQEKKELKEKFEKDKKRIN